MPAANNTTLNPEDDILEEDDYAVRQRQLAEEENDESLLQMVIPPPPDRCLKLKKKKSRLILNIIKVQNFKSYLGVHVLGPFHKNFTAIVGPNGSGKSNVIDALLFVFGIRSSRIRSRKVTDLIHNSARAPNCQHCSVAVQFKRIIDKNEMDYWDVIGSDFVISREVEKSGKSTYRLNGEELSIKVITEKMRGYGIDLTHNRFLILQGEVEQISLMKPKAEAGHAGMLEYLEDLIGSYRFKVPIDLLAAKQEILNRKRAHQLYKARKVDKEREKLEGPVRKTILYYRTENQIARQKARILYSKRLNLKNEMVAESAKIVDLTKKKNEKEAEMMTLSDENQNKDDELSQKEKDKEQMMEELEATKLKVQNTEQKDKKLKQDMKRCSADITRLAQALEKEKEKVIEFRAVPTQSAAKIKECNEEIVGLKKIEQKNQAVIDKNLPIFEKRIHEDKKQKTTLEESLGGVRSAENKAALNLVIAQEELQIIESKENNEKMKLADCVTQYEDAFEKVNKKTEELEAINVALPEVTQKLAETRNKLTETKDDLNKISKQMEAIRQQVDAAQSVDKLRKRDALHKCFMKAKANGTLPGMIGRLGDLGGVDPKYDVAVSNAMGGLNSYVVRTKDDGTDAIELVRKVFEPQGIEMRAHLIILEMIPKYEKDMANKKFPCTRLFDLINIPDKEIRKVFYRNIGDTLVTESLEETAQLVKKYPNFRYIDINANIYEMNGVVIGGGVPLSGLIGKTAVETKASGASLAALTKKMEEKSEEHRQTSNKMHELDQKIRLLKNEETQLTNNKISITKELNTLKSRLTHLKRDRDYQQEYMESVVVDQNDVKKKTTLIAQLKKIREEANEAADKVQAKVDVVQKKLDQVYAELIKSYREEGNAARERRRELEKEVAKEQSNINAASRNLDRAKNRVEEIEKDKIEKEELIVRLEADIEENKNNLEELQQKKEELEETLVETEAEIQEMMKANEVREQLEEDLLNEKQKLADAIVTCKETVEDCEEEIRGINKQISQLRLFRIPRLGIQREEEDRDPDLEDVEDASIFDNREIVEEDDFTEEFEETVIPEPSDDEVRGFSVREMNNQMKRLEKKLAERSNHRDGRVIVDYKKMLVRCRQENDLLDQMKSNYQKHIDFYENLKKQRLDEFMDGFNEIRSKLASLYNLITSGGSASLDIKDVMDPFGEGVQFMVRPPKKSWRTVDKLSGGEKTLSSLALVFALHEYRPTPLYVMDEIDAALDCRNVAIIGEYIKGKAPNAQFIIISLREQLYELANRLTGVYKNNDCTMCVMVDPLLVAQDAEYRMSCVLAPVKSLLERGYPLGPQVMHHIQMIYDEYEAQVRLNGGSPTKFMEPMSPQSQTTTQIDSRKRGKGERDEDELDPAEVKRVDDRSTPMFTCV